MLNLLQSNMKRDIICCITNDKKFAKEEEMSNQCDKPKCTGSELVQKMKNEKGITFKYVSEESAANYLDNVNNYLRTAAYRKNYQKQVEGQGDSQKYISLDFAYLQELSTIDMHLRHIITKMCIDIEHAMKVQLGKSIANDRDEDGYEIVKEFLSNNNSIVRNLESKIKSPFTGELIQKYFVIEKRYIEETGREINKIVEIDCPVWVLNELLSFGEFTRFYQFCGEKLNLSVFPENVISLIRGLRNGCAHNNCIIADLNPNKSYAPKYIKKEVAKIDTISKDQRRKKLTSRPLLEFTCMVYVYSQIVSEKVKYHRVRELIQLFDERIKRKKGFFEKNELILSSYDYSRKIIEYFLK